MTENNSKRIYLSPPHMGGSEQKYIQDAFDTNWISPLGPNLDAFEAQLAEFTGMDHAAALSSGTAALHLALIMLNVQPEDAVLCQSFTFAASVNPVTYLRATPVLIDSEPETWNMDPVLLEKAIKDLAPKKPKAIIPVHLYGMPAQIDRILEIGEKYGIPIIEDAAEALGGKYKNKPLGSFGEMSILSFNGNKIITSSGGGALLSNQKHLIDKVRFLATQARDPAPHYQHSEIGYNYRMSNVVAGIGRGQMEVINHRIHRRREIFKWYKERLENMPGIQVQNEPYPEYYSNRWLTTILIDPTKAGFTHSDLRQTLERKNIESRPLWKPMHLQPVFARSPAYISGVSEQLFSKGLCLPSGSSMTIDDLDRIYDVINSLSN